MKPSDKLQIIIACHKECDVPKDPAYLPLHVGCEGKPPIGFAGDNAGDNISIKNPVYCELTGLYWAWKNLDSDYYGLVHYRRFLTVRSKSFCKTHPLDECVLSGKKAMSILKDKRIILPKRREYYIENLYSHYAHTFDGRHLKLTRRIIAAYHPDYLDSFDSIMNSTSGYMFNMFIMERSLADDYCSWLFDILFKLEKKIDTTDLSDFQMRYAGRVAERLFNVWLLYNIRSLKIKSSDISEIPWFYTGNVNMFKKATSFLGAKFFNKKYEESF